MKRHCSWKFTIWRVVCGISLCGTQKHVETLENVAVRNCDFRKATVIPCNSDIEMPFFLHLGKLHQTTISPKSEQNHLGDDSHHHIYGEVVVKRLLFLRKYMVSLYLLGGFNHLEESESQWEGVSHVSHILEHKTCSKPPTRYGIYTS